MSPEDLPGIVVLLLFCSFKSKSSWNDRFFLQVIIGNVFFLLVLCNSQKFGIWNEPMFFSSAAYRVLGYVLLGYHFLSDVSLKSDRKTVYISTINLDSIEEYI